MAITVLEQHRKLTKERSRGAWSDYVGRSRMRELFAYGIAVISTLTAAGAVALAYRTASSVVVQSDVRTVDHFGQVIGESGAVYRIPAGLQTHAFLSKFITDVFTVYASGPALQRDYAEAQAAADGQSGVGGILRQFWSGYSPLRGDLSWDRSREQERTVAITSILDRGRWTNGPGAEEYEVEWSIASVSGDGHLGQPTFYRGDLAVASGATRTDANPWGLLVTHFSWDVMR